MQQRWAPSLHRSHVQYVAIDRFQIEQTGVPFYTLLATGAFNNSVPVGDCFGGRPVRF